MIILDAFLIPSLLIVDAKKYADDVGALFIETSAKNSTNVNELFINGTIFNWRANIYMYLLTCIVFNQLAINLYRNTFASKNTANPGEIVTLNNDKPGSFKCC